MGLGGGRRVFDWSSLHWERYCAVRAQAGWASQACGVEIEGGNKCAKWVRRVV